MSSGPSDPLKLLRNALPTGFKIEGYLDGGAQGAVFKGTCQKQPVALKVFTPGAEPRRLEREITLLQSITCPHLVSVVETATIDIGGVSRTVIAYELLEGGDLRRHLAVGAAQLSEAQLVTMGCQISEAIEALWKKRIVHRDIKPANIVSSTSGRNVLVDVGLARHLDLSDITLPGHAAGTPGYMSPEQARGRRALTLNSDIFSLGVTIYELAARVHPFNRSQHLIGALSPRSLQQLRSDVSRPLAALVMEMLSPVPAHRPGNLYARFSQLRKS